MSSESNELTHIPNSTCYVSSPNSEFISCARNFFYSQLPSRPIPLPSIHTFQGLQPLATPKQQSVGGDCPITTTIKTETDLNGLYPPSREDDSKTIGQSVAIKSEPPSPSRHALSPCSNSFSPYHQNWNQPRTDDRFIVNTTATTCGVLSKMENVQPTRRKPITTPKTASKRARTSSSVDNAFTGDVSHALPDSTTNVAELMNSLQMWMNRWNESNLPGAPQISITITPRSDSSPVTEESSSTPIDAEGVIRREVERGHLFECTHCRLLFRERGLYFLHASLHDSIVPFKCSVCGRTCKDRNDFQLHFINQPHHD